MSGNGKPGVPPVVFVEGGTLPEAWEQSVLETWRRGAVVETEYGQRSKDVTMVILVRKPMDEPRIHRAGLTVGRLSDLETYVREVLDGVNDWRIGKDWDYTYHERLFGYRAIVRIPVFPGDVDAKPVFRHPVYNIQFTVGEAVINQIDYVVGKLAGAPYTRRAQAITWQPWKDMYSDSPPCLQRLWFRIVGDSLVMHALWRSRDAFKAAFMNMYALTMLQARVAEMLSGKLGRKIQVGYYLDFSDSYHIYERDWKTVEKFVETVGRRPFKQRTWTTRQYRKMMEVAGR